jgi:cell division protein FtsL
MFAKFKLLTPVVMVVMFVLTVSSVLVLMSKLNQAYIHSLDQTILQELTEEEMLNEKLL